jgi:hypothetical protein
VDLGDERDAIVLQSLDHPDLPERTIAMQLPRSDVRKELAELVHPSGGRATDTTHMHRQIESGVLDPDGVVDASGYLDDATPERWEEVQAVGQHVFEPPEGVAALNTTRVDHRDLEGVHVERGRLHIEEARVETGETLHGL